MKKKIYKYLSVAVIAVAMAVSFQMSKANNANDLTMENVEALACYSLEIDGTDWGECCYPYDVDCHVFALFQTTPGTWYF